MIEDPRGNIDYDEEGSGPTILFVPGSWGTRSAWRGVMAALGGNFRLVTTSLLGYGGTAERRTPADLSIDREAEISRPWIAAPAAPCISSATSSAWRASQLPSGGRSGLRAWPLSSRVAFGLLGRYGTGAQRRMRWRCATADFAAFRGGDTQRHRGRRDQRLLWWRQPVRRHACACCLMATLQSTC